jgi:hypothetical protein
LSLIECTTPKCGNQTATYLCHQCVSDLQANLDKLAIYLPDLDVTIARLDNVRPQGGGGTKSTGSAAPANLDAVQMKINLLMALQHDAEQYALMPDAGQQAWLIAEWERTTELLLSGPVAVVVDDKANLQRLQDIQRDPMPGKAIIEWLKDKARIIVTHKDLNNWVERGKLRVHGFQSNGKRGRPERTFDPIEVLEARHATRREFDRITPM